MVAEFFSQGPRPAATSISGSVNWLSGFIVAITFPSIQVDIMVFYHSIFVISPQDCRSIFLILGCVISLRFYRVYGLYPCTMDAHFHLRSRNKGKNV